MATKKNTDTASTAADDASTPRDRGYVPVVITTERRGVFFGWMSHDTPVGASDIRLELARNCIKWSKTIGGVLGLAANGPNQYCIIGATAPAIRLRGVVSVSECSSDATKRWEEAPCVA